MRRKKLICGDDLLRIELIKGYRKDNFYKDPTLMTTIESDKLGIKNLFLSVENYLDENTYTPKEIIEGVNVFKKDYQVDGFKIPKRSSFLIYQNDFSPVIIYTGYEVSKNRDQIIVALRVSDLIKIRHPVTNYEIIIIGNNVKLLINQLILSNIDENQIIHVKLEPKDDGILITNKRGIIKH